ncbi:MAG: hypothetical protein RJB38_1236 [Pseudomonadota bacterium]
MTLKFSWVLLFLQLSSAHAGNFIPLDDGFMMGGAPPEAFDGAFGGLSPQACAPASQQNPCDFFQKLSQVNSAKPRVLGVPLGHSPKEKCEGAIKRLQTQELAGAPDSVQRCGLGRDPALLAQVKAGEQKLSTVSNLALQGIASADFLLGEASSLNSELCQDAQGLASFGTECRKFSACVDRSGAAEVRKQQSLETLQAWVKLQEIRHQTDRLMKASAYFSQGAGVRGIDREASLELLQKTGFDFAPFGLDTKASEVKGLSPSNDFKFRQAAAKWLQEHAQELGPIESAVRSHHPMLADEASFMQELKKGLAAHSYPPPTGVSEAGFLKIKGLMTAQGEPSPELKSLAEKAYQTQLVSTRKSLMNQLPALRRSAACLSGRPGDCDPEQIAASFGDFEVAPAESPSSGGASSDGAKTSSIGAGECMWKQVAKNQERKTMARGVAQDLGITLAMTLSTGLGGVESAAVRLAPRLRKAADLLAGAGRLRKSLGAAASAGSAAQSLVLGRESFERLVHECGDQVKRFGSGIQGSACPTAQDPGKALVSESQSCVMDAVNIAFAAMGLHSGFDGMFKSTRSGAAKLASASAVERSEAQRLEEAARSSLPVSGPQSEFLPISKVQEFARANKNNSEVRVLVLDAPNLSPQEAKELGVTVIDHHGAYRNAKKPYENTTRKIVDAFESSSGATKNGSNDSEVKEAFYRKLLSIPDGQPVPKRIAVSTDNLGDAALAQWIVDHPDFLRNSENRRLLKMGAFHEDFAHFGTKYLDYQSLGGATGRNFKASGEFAQAVMGANDKIIREMMDEAQKTGKAAPFIGDRFSDAPAELQSEIFKKSVSEIDRLMKDPEYRSGLAQALRKNIDEAIPEIQKNALISSSSHPMMSKANQELGADASLALEKVALIDGNQISASRGTFTNWGAIPAAHEKPLQLQMTSIPKDGQPDAFRTFILAIPQGRKNQGMINEEMLQAIRAASQAKDPTFDINQVMMRDSGLLFSFKGVPLTKEELTSVVLKQVLKSKKGGP